MINLNGKIWYDRKVKKNAMQLRPRQTKAIDDLRLAYKSGKRAPILVAPTGFGKTAVASVIIKSSIERGKKIWFLAHLEEILQDTSFRLQSCGIPHGFIASQCTRQYSRHVQVVSVQTAVRRDDLPLPDIIIIDECHLAVANTYKKVIESVGNPLLLGLTGTAERLDGKGLNELFDEIVPTCSTGELAEEGLLAPIRYLTPNASNFSPDALTEQEIEEFFSKPKIVGDSVDHYREHGHGKPGVMFCQNIQHAEDVATAFANAGYRSMAISGESSKSDRRAALEGIKSGNLDIVANCGLWVAGVDAPNIQYIGFLRHSKSLTFYLQAVGRGLRTCKGKTHLIIADHAGNLKEHGSPLMEREWSLEGRKARKKKENPIQIRECPNCLNCHVPAPICPFCGHVYHVAARGPTEEVDGRLEEIDLKALEEAEKQKKKQEQSQARSFDELFLLGTSRNYKDPAGWARHMLSARLIKDRYNAQTYEELFAIALSIKANNPAAWSENIIEARKARAGQCKV